MRCGIIGLPQVGKTTLFQIVTRTQPSESHHKEDVQHIGVVTVPDDRLDRLAKLFSPAKLTYATVEYADLAPVGKETLKEASYLAALRTLDSLVHVVRLFRDDAVPHIAGSVDPRRDITNVEVELILADLGVVENRLQKLEKERKKIPRADAEKEQALLGKVQQWLETEKPLREAEWSAEELKQLKGFSFLSAKPMLYVLNAGEESAGELEEMVRSAGLDAIEERRQTRATAIAGKLEAEMALLPDADAAEFMRDYGLKESGVKRVIRATYELMGLLSFFTLGEKECRAWSIPRGATAMQAAGAIHTDLEKHFIRAEVIAWDKLLETGDLTAARQKGILRLEGKDYVVQDGEMVHIRHSG